MIAWRREFHRFPELSFQEIQTTKKLEKILKDIGLKTYAGKEGIGVVADLQGTTPGPTVALRADN